MIQTQTTIGSKFCKQGAGVPDDTSGRLRHADGHAPPAAARPCLLRTRGGLGLQSYGGWCTLSSLLLGVFLLSCRVCYPKPLPIVTLYVTFGGRTGKWDANDVK